MKNYNIVYSTMSFNKELSIYKREISYHSESLNHNIINTIIFPKSYYELKNKYKYPVVYLLNINNELSFFEDKLYDFANDNDIIFISVKYNISNDNEYELYMKYLCDELIIYINKSFNVTDKRSIYGILNGGALAINMLFNHTDIFNFACISCPENKIKLSSKNNEVFDKIKLYIDESEKNNNFNYIKNIISKLKDKNISVNFLTYHNINDEDYYYCAFDNYIEIFNKLLK